MGQRERDRAIVLRAEIKRILQAYPGIMYKEIASMLNVGLDTVGHHVAIIRAEWRGKPT